jgi:hypothetical protein
MTTLGNLPIVADADEANNAFTSVNNVLGAIASVAAGVPTKDRVLISDATTGCLKANTDNITAANLATLAGQSTPLSDQFNAKAGLSTANTFQYALNTSANVGAKAAVATVVVTESGDGVNHVTKLVLTNYIIGPLASAAAAKCLVPPQALYVFPAGVHLQEVSYMSIALTATGTAVSPEIGLGSVVGDGSANATIGAAGATMEDIMEGFVVADTVTHAAVANGPVGATAGILTGISLNKAADSKNVFLNCAGTWNLDNTGNLTASGTIIIKWTSLV